LSIFNKFKPCSGLDNYAKEKIKQYEKSEEENKKIKKEIPKVKNIFDEVVNENNNLKALNNKYVDDFYKIYCYSKSNNIVAIKKVLEKYFTEKINSSSNTKQIDTNKQGV